MMESTKFQEGAQILTLLRALGSEEQCIAYAVLQGMHLQQKLDEQRELKFPAKSQPQAAN